MIELVFFGMIGMLGLWMREVHNSRVELKEVKAPKQLKASPRKIARLMKK